MFRPHTEPLLLTQASIQALCPSLNSPVLNGTGLPVGPARAAILLFAGSYGSLELAVGVRSLETGATAVFLYRGGLEEGTPPVRAIELAAGFGERLGFLFDEDVVADKGRDEAFQDWQTLMGELDSDGPELVLEAVDGQSGLELAEPREQMPPTEFAPPVELGLPPPQPLEDSPGLDALADLSAASGSGLELDLRTDGATASGRPVSAPAAPAAEARTLTKFRGTSASPRAASQPGANALGRIPIVKRRLEGENSGRAGWLARLLASF